MTAGRAVRTFIAGFAALSVMSLAILPPEHVHVAGGHDGHHADVVHRHYAPHHPANRPASIGDHDDQPLWLDALFTMSTRVTAPARRADTVVLKHDRPVVPSALPHLDTVMFAAPLIDDPPLATASALRAPPASI